MKKNLFLKSITLLFVAIIALLLSTLSASAISDDVGDVWRYYGISEVEWGWEHYVAGKPNIDITDVSYSITGSEVTVTMTVAGTIEDSERIMYNINLVSVEETSYYQVYYLNGTGMYTGYGAYSGSMGLLENLVSDNTISATFEIIDPDVTYTIYGWITEYRLIGDESGEAWYDYAPDTNAPWFTGDDDDDDDEFPPNGDDIGSNGNGDNGGGTPGFEAIAVIVALATVLILLKKKK